MPNLAQTLQQENSLPSCLLPATTLAVAHGALLHCNFGHLNI